MPASKASKPIFRGLSMKVDGKERAVAIHLPHNVDRTESLKVTMDMLDSAPSKVVAYRSLATLDTSVASRSGALTLGYFNTSHPLKTLATNPKLPGLQRPQLAQLRRTSLASADPICELAEPTRLLMAAALKIPTIGFVLITLAIRSSTVDLKLLSHEQNLWRGRDPQLHSQRRRQVKGREGRQSA